jgi:hypothetical protein
MACLPPKGRLGGAEAPLRARDPLQGEQGEQHAGEHQCVLERLPGEPLEPPLAGEEGGGERFGLPRPVRAQVANANAFASPAGASSARS